MKPLLTALALALSLSGCYRVHVRSGLPPGDLAPDHDSRWHHAFLFGLAVPQGAIPLTTLCPQGWAEIEEQTDLLTGVASVFSMGVYTPHRVTIVCARLGHDVPAMFGYDPLQRSQGSYPAIHAGDPPPPPRPSRPSPVNL